MRYYSADPGAPPKCKFLSGHHGWSASAKLFPQPLKRSQQLSSQSVPRVIYHQLCRGQGHILSLRQCTHMDSIRPMHSKTWSFGGGLNTKKMVPSCTLYGCQAPHQDNHSSCPSSPCTKATQLTLSPNVPGPPQLLSFLQRPGECLQENKSLCSLYAVWVSSHLMPHQDGHSPN